MLCFPAPLLFVLVMVAVVLAESVQANSNFGKRLGGKLSDKQ